MYKACVWDPPLRKFRSNEALVYKLIDQVSD